MKRRFIVRVSANTAQLWGAYLACFQFLLAATSGCGTLQPVRSIAWSPDSQTIAFLGLGLDAESLYLYWFSIHSPQRRRFVLLTRDRDEAGKQAGPSAGAPQITRDHRAKAWVKEGGEYRFSPNSQLVAVLTPSGIAIVDLVKGDTRIIDKPPEADWTDVLWLSNKEIAYVTRDGWGDSLGHVILGRSIWAKTLDDRPRRLIYTDGGYLGPVSSRLEWFSPDGRFAIFATSKGRECPKWETVKLHLLDMRSGKTSEIAEQQSMLSAEELNVSWKNDGSAALVTFGSCIGLKGVGDSSFYYIDTASGEKTDLSQDISQAAAADPRLVTAGFGLSPTWTTDGKFVALHIGPYSPECTYLLQPRPFKLLPVTRAFASRVSPGVTFRTGAGVFPGRGWLWSVGPPPECVYYAIRYDSSEIVLLGRLGYVSYDWGLSRQGECTDCSVDLPQEPGFSPDGRWHAQSDGTRVCLKPLPILPDR